MTADSLPPPKTSRNLVMLAVAGTILITAACLAPLVLWPTPITALLGLVMGLVTAAALAAFWRNRRENILALVGVPIVLVVICAFGHVGVLWHLDKSHDLRTIGVVLMGWIVVMGPYITAFTIARAGLYRKAAKRSQGASLLLLLFVVIASFVSATAFEGETTGSPMTYVYVVISQLEGICFMTGILIIPITLIRHDRLRRDSA